MSKIFKQLLAAIAAGVVLTVSFLICHIYTENDIFLSLYITFMTITYHFLMRVLVGEIVTVSCKQHSFNYESFWWRQHGFEKKLYKLLRVKKWKIHMITAKPEQFDLRQRTVDELLFNMTQAELVHEIIMILSFAPILLIRWYGAAGVFIITSVLACLMDLAFVIIQRYNRPRVMKIRRISHGGKTI